jgi:hypothetical protein
MKVQRIILVFKKEEEAAFKEIKADVLEFDLIKKLFTPMEDDPFIYRPYAINEFQYLELMKKVPELKDYPIAKFDLYIEGVTV